MYRVVPLAGGQRGQSEWGRVASAIHMVYLPSPAHPLMAGFALLWPQISISIESCGYEQPLPAASAPRSTRGPGTRALSRSLIWKTRWY